MPSCVREARKLPFSHSIFHARIASADGASCQKIYENEALNKRGISRRAADALTPVRGRERWGRGGWREKKKDRPGGRLSVGACPLGVKNRGGTRACASPPRKQTKLYRGRLDCGGGGGRIMCARPPSGPPPFPPRSATRCSSSSSFIRSDYGVWRFSFRACVCMRAPAAERFPLLPPAVL